MKLICQYGHDNPLGGWCRECKRIRERERQRKKIIATRGHVVVRSLAKTVAERFAWYLCYMGDCIIWTGGTFKCGYGEFMASKGRPVYAHRFSYEQQYGSIPDGLELDHLCRNKICVNPGHLQPVTHQVNVRRAWDVSERKRQYETMTHCKNGHPFIGANITYRKDGGRRCLVCHRLESRVRRAAFKQHAGHL